MVVSKVVGHHAKSKWLCVTDGYYLYDFSQHNEQQTNSWSTLY